VFVERQKLTKFIEGLQMNSSLWQNLEQHHKAGQIVELKESPQIESLITKIFKSNSQIQREMRFHWLKISTKL
jgi:hypothetical protein